MRGAPAQPPRGAPLLLVFLHGYVRSDLTGFKGSAEHTFGAFPERLAHMLQQTHQALAVELLVYPTYETRGALRDATSACLGWLRERIDERTRAGAPPSVVLVGHSMGGILAAEVALAHDAPPVCGILAFDTPFHGVNPYVFKHQFHSYAPYAASIRRWGSMLAPLGGGLAAKLAPTREDGQAPSRWTSAAIFGAGVLATGLVGASAAQVARKIAVDSYTWVVDHVAYVGTLWDEQGMSERVRRCEAARIPIHCVYNVLAGHAPPRTFVIVPPAPAHIEFAALEQEAPDEVAAHCAMFRSDNPAYFGMGLGAAAAVSSWLG